MYIIIVIINNNQITMTRCMLERNRTINSHRRTGQATLPIPQPTEVDSGQNWQARPLRQPSAAPQSTPCAVSFLLDPASHPPPTYTHYTGSDAVAHAAGQRTCTQVYSSGCRRSMVPQGVNSVDVISALRTSSSS